MSEIRPENSDRAFPHLDEWGLSKREYFAAAAMQGMITGSQGLDISTEEFGTQSVKLADALITALNDKKND